MFPDHIRPHRLVLISSAMALVVQHLELNQECSISSALVQMVVTAMVEMVVTVLVEMVVTVLALVKETAGLVEFPILRWYKCFFS